MNEILEMKDKILEYWDYRSSDYHTEYAKCMDEEMEIWKSVFSEILLTDKKNPCSRSWNRYWASCNISCHNGT